MAFSSWYYGMDDASALDFPCAGDGPNFYIGNIGAETEQRSGYFDEATAAKAGKAHTFAVWDVAGPNSPKKPSGMSAEDWGSAQGNAFNNALTSTTSSSQYAQYIGGLTFFGDIQPENGGWDEDNYDNNTATLFGFLDSIWGGDGEGASTAGVYIGQDFWNEYFGSNYTSQIPIVVWAAGTSCPASCSAATDEFNSTYADMVIGGYKVMIWQYLVNYDAETNTGCPGSSIDADITPYAGYQDSKWNPTN